MSVLGRDHRYSPPADEEVARRIKQDAANTFEMMVRTFNEGAETFWRNRRGLTPQQIADQLGTDAAEVFDLHYRLGQLISQVDPNSIAHGLSLIGTVVVNEDGTITVS